MVLCYRGVPSDKARLFVVVLKVLRSHIHSNDHFTYKHQRQDSRHQRYWRCGKNKHPHYGKHRACAHSFYRRHAGRYRLLCKPNTTAPARAPQTAVAGRRAAPVAAATSQSTTRSFPPGRCSWPASCGSAGAVLPPGRWGCSRCRRRPPAAVTCARRQTAAPLLHHGDSHR